MKHLPRKHRLLVSLCCISLTVCLWLGNITYITTLQIGKATNAQNSTSSQWVQEGVNKYQANQYLNAIKDWNKALDIEKNNSNPRNKAIILENLARAYQQVGQTENAIKHWENVVQLHSQLRDVTKKGRSLTELAQVYTSYGQPKKAIQLLCNNDTNTCQTGSALQIAKKNNDFEGQVAALGSLGEAYRLLEGCEVAEKDDKQPEKQCKAMQVLEEADDIINKNKVDNKNYKVSILNSRANIYINSASLKYRRAFSLKKRENIAFSREVTPSSKMIEKAEGNDRDALKEFEESYKIAQQIDDKSKQIKILLNEIPIYYRTKQDKKAKTTWIDAKKLLQFLPTSSQTAYTYIDLADKLQQTVDKNGLPISMSECSQEAVVNFSENHSESESEAINLLQKAVNLARQIKDSRAESFAQGKLGKLYECSNEYNEALKHTKQARDVIEKNLAAKDSLFLWEWQAGRILKKQGKIADAIIAYKNSKNSLEKVRQEILSDNRNFQFDFRDEVEPIYRDLIGLQLNTQVKKKENKLNQNNNQDLLGALETMDSLKIGELQNYFGNDCILTIPEEDSSKPNNSDNQDQNKFQNKILSLIGNDKQTAIISSIILDNKIAIILTLPTEESKINLSEITLLEQVSKYSDALRREAPESQYLKPAKIIYDEVIGKFEQSLTSQIKTLVFVQDGVFQNVPMAALYDGKKFLVEKYAVATTPSLLLTDNKDVERNNLQVLALGLSDVSEISNNSQLKYVKQELDAIPNKTQLENEKFTRENIIQELNKQIYSVIHIATHGNFGVEQEDTYLEAWNKKITINELDEIIRNTTRRQNRIDLLALTACNTAVGDERSSLGLAGVAIRAGTKSTLASLWSIDDKSTAKLVDVFYKGWKNPKLTKAQALQEAQKALIKNEDNKNEDNKYKHPYYWAPFVLVGNWQ
ncbi:TPR repeat [Calothrix sp. PCC 7716]|nr:TPR repeat [Calothrix sp. PCC 7716]